MAALSAAEWGVSPCLTRRIAVQHVSMGASWSHINGRKSCFIPAIQDSTAMLTILLLPHLVLGKYAAAIGASSGPLW